MALTSSLWCINFRLGENIDLFSFSDALRCAWKNQLYTNNPPSSSSWAWRITAPSRDLHSNTRSHAVMTLSDALSDELISKLTHNVELDLPWEDIRDLPPARPSAVRVESIYSSLGLLDKLPLEVVILTLNLLDFQTLFRFTRVSIKGKGVVETLPAYRTMMEHAPQVFTALRKTRLLRYHSASSILQALQSDKCVSCLDYGALLFLPTCERVCTHCLDENKALWVITTDAAKKYFGLNDSHLERVSIMQSIPVGHPLCFYLLISVKAAKELGIKVHGSAENLAKLIPEKPEIDCTEDNYLYYQAAWDDFYYSTLYQAISMEFTGREVPPRIYEETGDDHFQGMAYIRIPFLNNLGADLGHRCEGCQVTYDHFVDGSLPEAGMSELHPPHLDEFWQPVAGLTRIRPRAAFVEHVQHCYGAQKLLAAWKEDE